MQRHARPVVHLSDSPTHVVQYLLALDAELSEHLVHPDRLRAFDAAQRPLLEAGMAAEHRKTYREKNEKAILAIDRRAELLELVETYRGLKDHLGLMDFSDQIALAARLAEQCPEVGAIERGKFKIVLLDEYQDTSVAQALMLSRLFSGPDAGSGLGHPVTAVGDPNQAIYGWRGASVSNILEFGQDFPARDGSPTTYPLTVNRRSDERILATANHLAADLYATRPELLPLEPKPGAAPGEVRAAVHETYDDELVWLADQVIEARAAMEVPSWREIGVLTRDNAHAAAVFDALSNREIPVEIVGLKGLLRLPEVSEVVATLTLVQDVTANAALLTLLAGPRWAIGPRDLALLGRRARELAGSQGGGQEFESVQAQLAAAVEGADPTEIASLCDALDDPGDLAYSAEARDRFGLLADELRRLRGGDRRADPRPGAPHHRHHRHRRRAGVVGQPGRGRPPRQPRPVRAGGRGVPGRRRPGHARGAAGLARGRGRLRPGPRRRDAVRGRLRQAAHRPPGQGPRVGRRLPGGRHRAEVPDQPHPVELAHGAVRDAHPAARRRPRPAAAGRPHPRRPDRPGRGRQGARGARGAAPRLRRLDPRPAPALGLGVVLGRSPQDRAAAPPTTCAAPARRWPAGAASPSPWRDAPPKGEPSPYAAEPPDQPWPISHHTAEVERRRDAAARVRAARLDEPDAIEDVLLLDRVQQWDDEITRLLEEAVRDRSPDIAVPLPSSLSATSMARLRDDPAAFARDLARPMPRRPSPAARFGTRFHAWVEARFGQQLLLDPDELPGRGDSGIDDDSELRELIKRFEDGPFADRVPHAVEPSFALVLAGQVVRGRIDAVYEEGDGFLVVDWKTNRAADADPLQLALYRVAWADLTGRPLASVRAAFYYVRSGEVVEPEGLPDREALERLLAPPDES